jgi:hypothetical protein
MRGRRPSLGAIKLACATVWNTPRLSDCNRASIIDGSRLIDRPRGNVYHIRTPASTGFPRRAKLDTQESRNERRPVPSIVTILKQFQKWTQHCCAVKHASHNPPTWILLLKQLTANRIPGAVIHGRSVPAALPRRPLSIGSLVRYLRSGQRYSLRQNGKGAEAYRRRLMISWRSSIACVPSHSLACT